MKRSSAKDALLVIATLIVLAAIGIGNPQQQFSGGQSVTVSNIPHVVVDTAPTTAVTGPLTDTQLRATAVSVSLPALAAGTSKIGITYPYTSCGTTAFTKSLQAMPTSSTAIASSTTCLLGFDVSNTSGGSLTVTVTDNAGTPINWLNAVTLLAGETRTYQFAGGKSFASGIKVQASGSGITYSAEGLQ